MPAPHTQRELVLRAQALHGHSLQHIAQTLGLPVPAQQTHAKGWIGQLIERILGADPKASDRPDFPDLGIELKTIPIGPKGTPIESTFCCSIRMGTADKETWESSRLKRRLQHVLWVPIETLPSQPLYARRVFKPLLWSPSAEQSLCLQHDWEMLMGWIGSGGAELLSAKQGKALQVRPKAQHASIRKWAPGEEGLIRTLPLGFYLRPTFTHHILQ